MEALYVIGEPGVGKSTFVKYLTDGLPYEETTSPFAFRRYECGVYELGARRPDFPGTDALGMSVQPIVEQYLEGSKPELVLAEGDRLANAKFFHALERIGYNLTVVKIVGSEVAAMQRRLRGSDQDATWLKGRQTKVNRLAEQFGAVVVPAGRPLSEMASLVSEPVTERMRAARILEATDAVL